MPVRVRDPFVKSCSFSPLLPAFQKTANAVGLVRETRRRTVPLPTASVANAMTSPSVLLDGRRMWILRLPYRDEKWARHAHACQPPEHRSSKLIHELTIAGAVTDDWRTRTNAATHMTNVVATASNGRRNGADGR
jgi:hypothetical protein